MRYNYSAYLQRNTMAIRANINTSNRQFVLRRACELLNKFDDYCKHLALTEWCKQFRLSEKMLRSYISGDESAKLTHTEMLREFLSTFVITENEISGYLSIERSGTEYTFDELTILVEEEGLKQCNLKKLLKPSNKNITVVKLENPLNNMFKDLAEQYRGEPLIHQLADCITAYDFGDKNNGYYQQRLSCFFHKWLCKAAGQALHIGSNDAMLLWIEPFGGSGKSQINQWLFSLPEFQQYYIKIGEVEPYIDMKKISRSKFAIDWDELPLTIKRYLMFKSSISSDSGQVYSRVTKSYEPYTRMVNFIGSTNKANRDKQRGFLLDDDAAMMRRIVPIEIEGQINYKKYTKDIDLKQLWGQAASDILNAQAAGNKKLLTWECDWENLREQNKRYVNKAVTDPKIITSVFQPAQKNQGTLLTSREIINKLQERGIKLFVNEMEIGHFMSKFGYEKGRNKKGRGFWVKN
jgi:predicted P-loop ATPase